MTAQVQQPQSQPRVLVGVPTTQTVDIRFHSNFTARIQTLLQSGGGGGAITYSARYGVAESREDLVNQFMGMPDMTHLLFYDTDIIPQENHCLATLLGDNLPVVSGLYFNSLYTGLAAWKDERPLTWQGVQQLANPLIEVDKVGAGFLLLKKDVFKLLIAEERPWFYYRADGSNMMSEDFYFFYTKLLKVGIKPYVDTRVRCDHIKTCLVRPDGSIGF